MLVVVGPLSLLIALGALDVRGTASCPTPAEVTERAMPLIPQGGGLAQDHYVEIAEIPPANAAPPATNQAGAGASGGVFWGGGIDIQLRSATGAVPLVSRRLPRTGSCGALAEAAAAILATWTARYDTNELGRARTDRPGSDGATARAADAAASQPVTLASRSSVIEPEVLWALGAGIWMTGAPRGGLAPTAGAEVTVQPVGQSPWFARLFAGATAEREVPIALGRAQWSRALLAPSVGGRWGWGRRSREDGLFIEASAGPVLAPVWVQGDGFSPNENNWALDVGLSSALRLGFHFGPRSRLFAWGGASALFWLRPHRIAVAMAPDAAANVPPVDVLLGIGGGYSFGR